MLKIEKTVLPSPEQWEIVIEGMRNPLNSWEKSDSLECFADCCDCGIYYDCANKRKFDFTIGKNDLDLMERLAKGGSVHAKYRRMIPVYLTLTAPLYWWKEFDTYKVGTVCNSCSTMHKIHSRPLSIRDFSTEWLEYETKEALINVISYINIMRDIYLKSRYKADWYQMIQLLPSSYNQKRTVMLNYEVLANIYHSRKGHKLDEWHTFCEWIEGLPYSELITGRGEER